MIITSSSLLKKLLLLFLVIAGLILAKSFLMPLTVAGVLATLFLPLSKQLEKHGFPKWLAVLSCLLILLLAMAGIISMLGWQISELIDDFELIKIKALETGARIQQYLLIHLGISLEKQMQVLKDQEHYLPSTLQLFAGKMAGIFTNIVLILVYVFCFLYYRNHLKQFLLRLSPKDQQPEMEQIIYSTSRVSQQYLLGLSKMIVCLWIMYGIGFSIIGVKNAVMFAILCGLLEIIPYIGNLTGTLLTLLVAAVNGASVPMLGSIVIVYGSVQLIQGWILEPLIVGPQVKINPFTTILSLVIGELIWGIPGIFLAIPVIAMLKIVFDHIDSLKPYGMLIGEINTGKKEPVFIKKILSIVKSKEK
jgi:predicted PurR-regulated permease PerM